MNETKRSWATATGYDGFGAFAVFEHKGVAQKLRYIEPGQFMMGSPATEKGRDNDETEHQVTLTEGFWLFDTPVTQALWQAVMGDNPSRFKSPTRPVEQVSWDDSKNFIKKLNAEIPGLALCLPTEAQWEYACRAGTTTATYAGEMEILGERNAPVLDDIAWYGGNSGVDFDLDEGWDSSDWPQKQYDHKKAGTCRVKQKQPNSWGLYDMLGNVWEWCEDWWQGNLGSESAEGPKGTREGADRVIRGGGWFDVARVVRAAYRINFVPGDRGNFLGIRCVRLQPLANSQLQSIYKETA